MTVQLRTRSPSHPVPRQSSCLTSKAGGAAFAPPYTIATEFPAYFGATSVPVSVSGPLPSENKCFATQRSSRTDWLGLQIIVGNVGDGDHRLQFFAVMNFQITATIPHATKQKMMRKMASVQRVALADSSAGNEARPLFTKCRNIFRSLPILVRPLDFGSLAGLLPIFLH